MSISSIKYVIIICLFILQLPFITYGQEKKDTTTIYEKMEKRADKHNFTRWVYDVIFDSGEEEEDTIPIITSHKKTVNPFQKYKGKIIRNIDVIVLDPFGYSVNRFYAKQEPDYLERVGNKYHVTTKEKIVKNVLLFKSNEEIDPLALSESERLLRLSPYIFDARIYVQKYKGDSVNVMVVTQDKWSTLAGSRFDLNAPNIKLTEKNFLGIGHQLEEDILWKTSDQYLATAGKYSIFNIKKTFITASVFYSTAKENKQFGASLDRPFYSPLAKWAGGISAINNNTYFEQTNVETDVVNKYALNYNTFDVWGAKSFPLTEQKSATIDKRSSSFILGERYFRTDYLDRPSFVIDSNRINRDVSLYLVNFGFSRRRYYRDRYLFRYGANEDIPQGMSAEVVVGVMQKELSSLWYYSGIKFGTGKHFEKFGYLAGSAGYGTFYNSTFVGLGVVNLDGIYFTDLIQKGRWYFRQFSRFKMIEGIDRESYENLNINGTQMYGFSSETLTAKSKMILNFELVMYAPYKIIGFQFAPVLLCGIAGMGHNFGAIFSSRFYQAYAIGLLIRNEYLVANTFEVSIGLYPYIPGSSDYIIKTNPITNYDVRAKDYMIAKPDLVSYQ